MPVKQTVIPEKNLQGLKTQYVTSDGRIFTDKDQALSHEAGLNNFDYKTAYYDLVRRIEALERKYYDPYSYKYPSMLLNRTETN